MALDVFRDETPFTDDVSVVELICATTLQGAPHVIAPTPPAPTALHPA
jgi:hypothetical protein